MSDLPQFRGYIIDYRRCEFRRMTLGPDGCVDRISFHESLGRQLLQERIIELYTELLAAKVAHIDDFIDEEWYL